MFHRIHSDSPGLLLQLSGTDRIQDSIQLIREMIILFVCFRVDIRNVVVMLLDVVFAVVVFTVLE